MTTGDALFHRRTCYYGLWSRDWDKNVLMLDLSPPDVNWWIIEMSLSFWRHPLTSMFWLNYSCTRSRFLQQSSNVIQREVWLCFSALSGIRSPARVLVVTGLSLGREIFCPHNHTHHWQKEEHNPLRVWHGSHDCFFHNSHILNIQHLLNSLGNLIYVFFKWLFIHS